MARRLLAYALAPALIGAGAAVAGQDRPRCFGAASRDPEQRCVNRALRLQVTPLPNQALLQGEGPCDPVGRSTELCTFGAPPEQAAETVALFGDSHAGHWRATLLPIAGERRWRGISLTRPSCPFSLSTPALPEPKRSQCMAFNQDVLAFARDNPAISTVFVSQHRAKIAAPPGADYEDALLQGYADAWDALPETVRRVVVIRDPNYQRRDTLDCVERAHERRRDAGRLCRLRRAASLRPDPAVIAARTLPHRAGLTVDVIDLGRFFCGRRWCWPVIGGVLVHRDEAHLTRLYAQTLAPYFARAYDRIRGVADVE